MSLCFVFSGTSEGREISEILAEKGVKCQVFVATEYGNAVMNSHENIEVYVGRLSKDEIRKMIDDKAPEYIVDATHPYAEEITKNIKCACEEANVLDKYLRVSRSINQDSKYPDTVIKVSDEKEAINYLKSTEGKILLTTGVKELKSFCEESIKKRLVVRVLPGRESIDEVYRCGIATKSVIAMEGPFSEEMNIALIDQYNISVVVTKNSGSRGGYDEKIRACKKRGIKALVISKDDLNEKGYSIDAAVQFICGDSKKKKVCLIGVGVCDENYLTLSALEMIKSSELIIGANRMIQFARRINDNVKTVDEYKPDEVFEKIIDSDANNISVLFSGDTGLCSGARGVYNRLKKEKDVDIFIIPGISSVSYFSSKLGIQYSDYPFISVHGKDYDCEELVKETKGFISICSGVDDVKKVAIEYFKSEISLGRTLYIGYNLGSKDERICQIINKSDLDELTDGLYIIALI